MHSNGPAVVLAGAGTGKTRTLIYRLARLVEDGVDPSSILLLTFTRKAAAEMIHRASGLLDGKCAGVSGGTFHGFAHNQLRRFAAAVGLPDNFTVLDRSDSEDVMNLVRSRFDVAKLKKRFPTKATLVSIASTAINRGRVLDEVVYEKYSQFADHLPLIEEVIKAFHTHKKQHGLVDYDDLLLYALALTRHEEAGRLLRQKYTHILVDEYQDTNPLQHNIVLGLINKQQNVMVVGDDAQSIYAFRGADIKNIHAFESSFESCKVIALEQNYRSTQPILDVANIILEGASGLYAKHLTATRTGGTQPICVRCLNQEQQSEFVVQSILNEHENGTSLNDIAVLIRSGFLSFHLEIELGKAGIPFRKVGGLKFTEAAHIKDVLALLRLTVNPRDTVSWYRILLLAEGIGQKSATAMVDAVSEGSNPFTDVVSVASGRARPAAEDLSRILTEAVTIEGTNDRLTKLLDWYSPVMQRVYDDHVARMPDIKALGAICSRYSSISSFLSDIALEPPTETLDEIESRHNEDEFVTLSTIHSAKGLEWSSVYLIWLNEGYFPTSWAAESEAQLEEERRLMYVACTRAKDTLVMTQPMIMAEKDFSDALGRPSRFLEEIEEKALPRFELTIVTQSQDMN